jgi:hypothetical protein
MKIKHGSLLAGLGGSLTWLLMAGMSFHGAAREAETPVPHQAAVTLYDRQPDHLWNRLHQALFVRTTPKGKTLGQDDVDPPLWPRTQHLLIGPSHEDALRLLGEFLTRDGDKLVRDPLKRAVLQHDLWAVFEWTAYPYGNRYGTEEYADARHALQRRLVQAMHRLALSPAAVASLPDNYAAAVKSRAFAPAYDPEHPQRPFLPDGLFDPEGPWACVGGPLDGPSPVALAHARFFSGRSVFLVFLRLPGGRQATLAYLDKLNHVPSPWVLKRRQPGQNFRPELLALAPDLPQFPVGTQVALVRQMVLLTDAGELAAAPVTESVQVRVYRRIRPGDFEGADEAENSQSFVEFDLRRSDLFADHAGGLHPVPAEEQAYLALQFVTGGEDPFEHPPEAGHSFVMPVLKTCAACHPAPGIYSVNSFSRRFSARPGQQVDLALWPTTVNDERHTVLGWKRQQYDWGLFQGLSAR